MQSSSSPEVNLITQEFKTTADDIKNLPNIIEPPSSDTNINDLPKIPNLNIDEMKSMMSNMNINDVINRMSNNPGEMEKIMAESMGKITPEMMDQARKLAMGGQGNQILKKMQQAGMNSRATKDRILKQQRALNKTLGKSDAKTKKALLITQSRVLKSRSVPVHVTSANVIAILQCSDPVQLSCSRLALGPLSGKTIKIWYDPSNTSKNRRTSRILGFPVGGAMLIVMDEDDLTEADFLAAEAKLA
jgi:hypothetical protein